MRRLIYKYRYILPLLLIIPLVAGISFRRIMDKTVKKRKDRVEYLVIHYTANTNPGSDAEANAYYLKNKRKAGTHYCVDDQETVQCTDEENVAYAVGDKKWFGFIPKLWLKNKVTNNNSLNYEMCLGGGRNDTIIIETTAQQAGFQMVKYGFYDKDGIPDMCRVVRHHDVTGKYCPKFNYIDPANGKFNENYWDQAKEDASFWKFKLRVKYWAEFHLKRLNKIKQKDAVPQLSSHKAGTW